MVDQKGMEEVLRQQLSGDNINPEKLSVELEFVKHSQAAWESGMEWFMTTTPEFRGEFCRWAGELIRGKDKSVSILGMFAITGFIKMREEGVRRGLLLKESQDV